MPATPEQQACLRVANVRGLVSVLHAIKASNSHQLCTVVLHTEGLSVQWEDESKGLQASVFLRKELFVEYNVPWLRKEFGLQFSLLLDTLHVFTAGSAELVLRYPGVNQELICEMTEEGAEGLLCTYASLNSVEVDPLRDLIAFWEGPESFFLVHGAMMKEVVDDMEWGAVSKSVEVLLQRSPARVVLSSHGMGGLLITLPVDQLASVHCATAEVRQSYKHKHLKTAFAHLPQSKEVTTAMGTKVTLDSQGMLKVTHMLSLGGAEARGGHYTSEAAYQDSQRVAEQQRVGMVQFLMIPEDAAGDEEDDF